MELTDITVPVLEAVGDFFSNDFAYVGDRFLWGEGAIVFSSVVSWTRSFFLMEDQSG